MRLLVGEKEHLRPRRRQLLLRVLLQGGARAEPEPAAAGTDEALLGARRLHLRLQLGQEIHVWPRRRLLLLRLLLRVAPGAGSEAKAAPVAAPVAGPVERVSVHHALLGLFAADVFVVRQVLDYSMFPGHALNVSLQ